MQNSSTFLVVSEEEKKIYEGWLLRFDCHNKFGNVSTEEK